MSTNVSQFFVPGVGQCAETSPTKALKSSRRSSRPADKMSSRSNPTQRVKVYLRCRPYRSCSETPGALCIESSTSVTLHRQKRIDSFSFDGIFPSTATQAEVYQSAVHSVVESVLHGFNGTVFAYGQTGAGKTHTLSSLNPESIGVIPRALGEIFSTVSSDTEHQYTIQLSFLQIYKERIQDLLVKDPSQTNLALRETAEGEILVSGAQRIEVVCLEDSLSLLRSGEKNRTTACTEMNSVSSRSHAVVEVTVVKKTSFNKVHIGRLFLVDLAGSERLKKSGSHGLRAEEAKAINVSLTTLGMCVAARAEGSGASHIPFRDSKLTRLLQGSLGGNSLTSLIVCCSDAVEHCEETLSTLQFGMRAMKVVTSAKVNVMVEGAFQNEMASTINELLIAKEAELDVVLSRLALEENQRFQLAQALQEEKRASEARAAQIAWEREQRLLDHKALVESHEHQMRNIEAQASLRLEEYQLRITLLEAELATSREDASKGKAQVQKLLNDMCVYKEQSNAADKEKSNVVAAAIKEALKYKDMISTVEEEFLKSKAAWETSQTSMVEHSSIVSQLKEENSKLKDGVKELANIVQMMKIRMREDANTNEELSTTITALEKKLEAAYGEVASCKSEMSCLAIINGSLKQLSQQQERSRDNFIHIFTERRRRNAAASAIQRAWRIYKLRSLHSANTKGREALMRAKTDLSSVVARAAELDKQRGDHLAFEGQMLLGDSLEDLKNCCDALIATFLLSTKDLKTVQKYNKIASAQRPRTNDSLIKAKKSPY